MSLNKHTKLKNTRLHLVQSFYGQYFHTDSHYKYFIEASLNNKHLENDFELNDEFITIFLNNFEIHQSDDISIIQDFLQKSWTIEKIELLLKAILTLALFELKHLQEYNTKLIIDDYVGITAMFYNAKEVGFINGILDKLARKIRPDQLI
jgi:transcription antitermination protein NusB